MGGEVSAITALVGMMQAFQKPPSQPDQSGQLAQERAAREEEQTRRETDDRKRGRDKVLEARQVAARKKAEEENRTTTLATGGAGLATPAIVTRPGLKKKLGE